MYAIHTTPGFVISARPYGEADKILSIFTRDLGLITATATGIRLEKSKLRYFAQEYTLGTYSVLRGKEFWRLTSAQAGEDSAVEGASDKTAPKNLDLIARIALLLRRFLQGEDPHPELFDCINELFVFLHTNDTAGKNLDEELLKTLESVTVFRILHSLGYIGEAGDLRELLVSNKLTNELLVSMAPNRIAINKHINYAIQESHL